MSIVKIIKMQRNVYRMKNYRKNKKEGLIDIIPYFVLFVMAMIVFSKVGITAGDDAWFYDAVKNVGNGT